MAPSKAAEEEEEDEEEDAIARVSGRGQQEERKGRSAAEAKCEVARTGVWRGNNPGDSISIQ